jgi:cell division septation protein DedD
MLRGLVLVLLVLNVTLFFWLRSDPAWTQADRDPQRLEQQVAPQSVTRQPEAARGSAAAASTSASAAAAAEAEAASGAALAAPGAPNPVASSPAAKGAAAAAAAAAANACVESIPLPAAEAAALQRALDGYGFPASSVTLRSDPQSPRWMVYMGRFADAAQVQNKAEELRKLNLEYAPVARPAGLSPGLSLGVFGSQANAESRLAELSRHGVHTARIVPVEADPGAKRVQVKLTDPSWRSRLPAERFAACTGR